MLYPLQCHFSQAIVDAVKAAQEEDVSKYISSCSHVREALVKMKHTLSKMHGECQCCSVLRRL